jgi:hypothetical protein
LGIVVIIYDIPPYFFDRNPMIIASKDIAGALPKVASKGEAGEGALRTTRLMRRKRMLEGTRGWNDQTGE